MDRTNDQFIITYPGELHIRNIDYAFTLGEYCSDNDIYQTELDAQRRIAEVNGYTIDDSELFVEFFITSDQFNTVNFYEYGSYVVNNHKVFNITCDIEILPRKLFLAKHEGDTISLNIPVSTRDINVAHFLTSFIDMELTIRHETIEHKDTKQHMEVNTMSNFSIDLIQKISTNALLEHQRANEELCNAYLQVAFCYIKNTANRGGSFVPVYCPYHIRAQFLEKLRELGYKTEDNKHKTNFYDVIWDIVRYNMLYDKHTT